MRKLFLSVMVATLMVATGSGTASAQPGNMLVIPIEMYVCNYNDKQDAGDLDQFVERWNEWMDSTANDSYAAWTLTPFYYGANQEFDFIWLGAGKNAEALGAAQDLWIQNPNGLNDLINEVSTCQAHTSFASVNFKAPPDGATPATSVLSFSDCSYKEGSSFGALNAATTQWAEGLTEQGSTAGIWHWYPVAGGGGEEFSFKWLEAHANFAEQGADFERYGNGAGFRTYGRLFGHLIDCDSSRVYVAQSRRFVQLR
jgi:hypothetical protein